MFLLPSGQWFVREMGFGQNVRKIGQGVELDNLRIFERQLSDFQFDNSFISVRPKPDS